MGSTSGFPKIRRADVFAMTCCPLESKTTYIGLPLKLPVPIVQGYSSYIISNGQGDEIAIHNSRVGECEHQRRRSARASAQSNQGLCYSVTA